MILLLFLFVPAWSLSALPLEGGWKAIGYYYENQFVQPSDPQLTMTFEFFSDGTHRLFWKYKNESSFCERKGLWHLQRDQLFMEVTWLNPKNDPTCGADPDMQMGLKTQSQVDIKNQQLWVQIPFGESYLIYVWERYEPFSANVDSRLKANPLRRST